MILDGEVVKTKLELERLTRATVCLVRIWVAFRVLTYRCCKLLLSEQEDRATKDRIVFTRPRGVVAPPINKKWRIGYKVKKVQ